MNFRENPFYLLEASPRDSKRVLHDKAENKSFEISEEECRNAEQILLNPRKRLEAELSWFPGVSPKKVKELLNQITEDSANYDYDIEFFNQLESLPRANTLAFFLSNIADAGKWNQEAVEKVIQHFCEAASEIDAVATLCAVNEDRVASGFSEISQEDVDAELEEVQFSYKKTLHDFLNLLDSNSLVDILTHLIENNTSCGEDECDWPLLESIISDYEIEVLPFFEKQETQIDADIQSLRDKFSSAADDQENVANDYEKSIKMTSASEIARYEAELTKLEKDVKLWDKIAQPIQILYKSNGQQHERSSDLASKIRNLALCAHNEYHMTFVAERISRLLSEVFAEVPLIAETVADDIKALTTIGNEKKIYTDLQEILKRYDVSAFSSEQAIHNVRACTQEMIALIEKLSDKKTGYDLLAAFILHFTIDYVNQQKDYSTGLSLLENAEKFCSDPKLARQIIQNRSILQQNMAAKKAQEESRISAIKWAVGFIFVFGIIGAVIGGCDRHGNVGEGFLGGLAFGAFFLFIGFLRSGRRL